MPQEGNGRAMKLIHCPQCNDVVRLWMGEMRHCHCEASWGRFLSDDLTAEIGGKAIPLCVPNDELRKAVANRPQKGAGLVFTACVIPVECETVKGSKK